jgi:hypothetical protein
MFLIRAAFWLALVIAFIPVNPEDLEDGQRPVTTGETIVAAQALLADLSGFCDRNPNACGTGRELFAQLGAKARTGLRHVTAYLEEQKPGDASPDAPATSPEEPVDPVDNVSTSSVGAGQ